MPNSHTAGAVIYAANPSTLATFYADVFGFDIVHAEPEYTVLESASFQIVFLATADARANIEATGAPVRRNDTAIKPVFYVRHLGSARKLAAELGGGLNSADREWRFQDSTVCDGYDLEGNVFQARQRVD